jgi:hypothetical protein
MGLQTSMYAPYSRTTYATDQGNMVMNRQTSQQGRKFLNYLSNSQLLKETTYSQQHGVSHGKQGIQWIHTYQNETELILSKSMLLYDRWSVSQSVCLGVEPTLGSVTRYYFLPEGCCLKVAVLFLWGALSDKRTRLQFAVQSLNGLSRAELITILYCLI